MKIKKFGEYLFESTKLTKALRKLGWMGNDWTPQEYKKQIKELSDKTLLIWYNDKDYAIPGTPLEFQQDLVKIEIGIRGLDKKDDEMNENSDNIKHKGDLPYTLYAGIKTFIGELISDNPDLSFDMTELKNIINEYIDLLEEDGFFDQY